VAQAARLSHPDLAELRAVLHAVRAPRVGRNRIGAAVCPAIFLAILVGMLHASRSHAWNSSPPRPRLSTEEFQMSIRSPAVRGLVAASSIAISSAAVAQDAVQ
jgi:hypothetical protein